MHYADSDSVRTNFDTTDCHKSMNGQETHGRNCFQYYLDYSLAFQDILSNNRQKIVHNCRNRFLACFKH